MFYYSVLMFPGAYWFLCKKTIQTMYVVGTYGPYLIKKIMDKKNNALENTTGESIPEDEVCLQHTKLS